MRTGTGRASIDGMPKKRGEGAARGWAGPAEGGGNVVSRGARFSAGTATQRHAQLEPEGCTNCRSAALKHSMHRERFQLPLGLA